VVRVLDALAGLLAAGVVVLAILLLAAQLIAPSALTAGWGPATGPGWPRVVAHLVVGAAGELVVRFRGRLPGPARATADAAVVVAAVVLVGCGWWP
jgi:hypothetical protein